MSSKHRSPIALSRRRLVQATAAAAASWPLVGAEAQQEVKRWAARPPAGFVRMSIPGKVVKVAKVGSMQPGNVFPTQQAARVMLERAMTDLTGKSNLADAFKLFVHPQDTVAIKPNGIAGKKSMKMATNKELVVEIVKGVVAAGVPAQNITIFEQYRDFLYATRCVTDPGKLTLAPEFPAGVKTAVHLNSDAVMDSINVGGIPTKFVRQFTDATVVINVPQVKDHAICGYTGALKNITHGANINPQHFHKHGASPQIADLYAQEVVKSRVALHIADAYQVIYEGGPIDKKPKRRVLHEAVYASTDPVAIDVIGWDVVEKLRRDNGLPTLKAVHREPTYLRIAGELGLGMYDHKQIRLVDTTI